MTPQPGLATFGHQIHCAEIWGGASIREDDVCTPGVCASIHSSASGDTRGGDIYYFSVCAYDTLTRIAVADVRGHGEAVSHLSSWLYQSLEKRMNHADGSAVLADLNGIVRERGFEAITTAVVATFHRDKRTLHYAYAGHPPLLLGRTSAAWQPLDALETAGPSNLPLGVFPGAKYTQQQVRIEPGDRLFFYSDGVSECPGAGEDDLFGDSRMREVLERTRGMDLREARHVLRRELAAYAGGPLVHDDCTFLLVEPLPPPPFWKRRIFAGKARPEAVAANRLAV